MNSNNNDNNIDKKVMNISGKQKSYNRYIDQITIENKWQICDETKFWKVKI